MRYVVGPLLIAAALGYGAMPSAALQISNLRQAVDTCRSEVQNNAADILSACERAVELAPLQAEKPDQVISAVRIYQGNLLSELGRPEEALSAFDDAIEHQPNLGAGYAMRGLFQFEQEQFDAALADLTQGIELGHETPGLLYLTGILHQKAGSWRDALRQYQAALAGDQSNADYLNAVAWTHYLLGQSQEGVSAAQRAIEIDPKAAFIDTLAHIRMDLGSGETAERLFRQAMEAGGREQVETYQQFLSELGFYTGPVTGDLDDATLSALRRCIDANCRLDQGARQ